MDCICMFAIGAFCRDFLRPIMDNYFRGGMCMETKLKKYFPMIREREEVLADIDGNDTGGT